MVPENLFIVVEPCFFKVFNNHATLVYKKCQHECHLVKRQLILNNLFSFEELTQIFEQAQDCQASWSKNTKICCPFYFIFTLAFCQLITQPCQINKPVKFVTTWKDKLGNKLNLSITKNTKQPRITWILYLVCFNTWILSLQDDVSSWEMSGGGGFLEPNYYFVHFWLKPLVFKC